MNWTELFIYWHVTSATEYITMSCRCLFITESSESYCLERSDMFRVLIPNSTIIQWSGGNWVTARTKPTWNETTSIFHLYVCACVCVFVCLFVYACRCVFVGNTTSVHICVSYSIHYTHATIMMCIIAFAKAHTHLQTVSSFTTYTLVYTST